MHSGIETGLPVTLNMDRQVWKDGSWILLLCKVTHETVSGTFKNFDHISSELSVVEVKLSSFQKLLQVGIIAVDPGVVERIITDSH